MPPRYAYWTILIDDTPTAFRAREREELQPTFVQLQRKNTNVTMKWFARGKLWASREAERDDFQMQRAAATAPRDRRDARPAGSPEGSERRGSEWRPGGTHKDPRDRFKKKNRPERAWSEKDPATQRDRDKPGYAAKKPWGDRKPWDKPAGPPRGDRPPAYRSSSESRPSRPGPSGPGEKRPWSGKSSDRSGPPRDRKPWDKPAGPPRGDRPWSGKPSDRSGPPRDRKPWDKPAASAPNDRPWQTKPTGPRAQRKPWIPKPSGDRPWSGKPPSGPPRGDRPWSKKPDVAQGFSPAKPRGDRPWSGKPPSGAPRGDRPWSSKPPAGGDKRPWSGKPREDRKPFTPRGPRSGGASGGPPRKRRDDDPDKH